MRQRPANEADAAELVERPADLGLEEHDDADQDRGRGVAEDPGQQAQVEQVGEQANQGQQQHAEHQLNRLRAADQQKHPVEEEGHQADVDQVEDMAPDVSALEKHQDVAENDVHFGD